MELDGGSGRARRGVGGGGEGGSEERRRGLKEDLSVKKWREKRGAAEVMERSNQP